MSRPYRTPNKRIIQRGSGGRFRRSTLADVGLASCETCGEIFFPDFSTARSEGGFVDPFKFAQLRRFCPKHGGEGTSTGLVPITSEGEKNA